jgi:hypothetical protein
MRRGPSRVTSADHEETHVGQQPNRAKRGLQFIFCAFKVVRLVASIVDMVLGRDKRVAISAVSLCLEVMYWFQKFFWVQESEF